MTKPRDWIHPPFPEFQKLPPLRVGGQVCSIVGLNEKQRAILNTDISHLTIKIDPKKENYDCLGRFLNEYIIGLNRSFNISMSRERGAEVIAGLFSLGIDYQEISRIPLLHRDKKVTDCMDYPRTLNSKTTTQVRNQINNICLKPFKGFEGASISDLLAGATPGQTFWEFSVHCLKNGIKLNP